jgi:hypothetical protein
MNRDATLEATLPQKEKNFWITWEGWTMELFLCQDGSLGITVDQPNPAMPVDPDSIPFVDIIIDKDLKVTSCIVVPED